MRLGAIKKMLSKVLAIIDDIGGSVEAELISPKGIYSKPKGEDAIIIPLMRGETRDIVFALQEPLDMKDGDVVVTDDNSKIYFHFDGKMIETVTKHFVIRAEDIKFYSNSLTHNDTDIGDTHIHTQGKDSGGDSQVQTDPPS